VLRFIYIYSRVIMGILWIVHWSMLLYLGGTVTPLKVIMGIHWMARWLVLVEFGHCCTTQSHNGHPVVGGLDWWVLMALAPSVVPSLARLAQAPVQGAP
jgi:hypothetical protein